MSDAKNPWSILHVDDDGDVLQQVREVVDEMDPVAGRAFEVKSCDSFDEGLQRLAETRYDLVILDVRAGDTGLNVEPEKEEGRRTLEVIKAARFVPIVFYTGLPGAVMDLEVGVLIQVEQKAESITRLETAIKAAVSSGLPSLRRGLEQHLTEVLRQYMWGFVADHHDTFSEGGDQADYLYLLLRRLSRSITGAVSEQLAQEVGFDPGAQAADGKVPPIRYYVMPPLEPEAHVTGDIYKADLSPYAPGPPFHPSSPDDESEVGGEEGENDSPDLTGFWVLITPICDLTLRHDGSCKADNVILARAERLDDQPEVIAWKGSPGDAGKKGKVKALLGNRRQKSQPDRFHYLPGAFDLPHLIVDFQQILSVPREALSANGVVRVATLDEPYGAELVSRFTNYLNRIGSPDLDVDGVIDSL